MKDLLIACAITVIGLFIAATFTVLLLVWVVWLGERLLGG